MKPEKYILRTEADRNEVLKRLLELPCDSKTNVTLSDAGSKSSRQRGLQFMWYGEVAKSGIGGKHEDTKEGVHLVCKFRWALPILRRDDPFFNDLYEGFLRNHPDNPEAVEWFIDTQVQTEKMTVSQNAEMLTEFQRYYIDKGVNLTDPEDLLTGG